MVHQSPSSGGGGRTLENKDPRVGLYSLLAMSDKISRDSRLRGDLCNCKDTTAGHTQYCPRGAFLASIALAETPPNPNEAPAGGRVTNRHPRRTIMKRIATPRKYSPRASARYGNSSRGPGGSFGDSLGVPGFGSRGGGGTARSRTGSSSSASHHHFLRPPSSSRHSISRSSVVSTGSTSHHSNHHQLSHSSSGHQRGSLAPDPRLESLNRRSYAPHTPRCLSAALASTTSGTVDDFCAQINLPVPAHNNPRTRITCFEAQHSEALEEADVPTPTFVTARHRPTIFGHRPTVFGHASAMPSTARFQESSGAFDDENEDEDQDPTDWQWLKNDDSMDGENQPKTLRDTLCAMLEVDATPMQLDLPREFVLQTTPSYATTYTGVVRKRRSATTNDDDFSLQSPDHSSTTFARGMMMTVPKLQMSPFSGMSPTCTKRSALTESHPFVHVPKSHSVMDTVRRRRRIELEAEQTKLTEAQLDPMMGVVQTHLFGDPPEGTVAYRLLNDPSPYDIKDRNTRNRLIKQEDFRRNALLRSWDHHMAMRHGRWAAVESDDG